MSATAAEPMFDATAYDLEGTPTLNGRKASSVIVGFQPFELDVTDTEHMMLAGLIRKGGSFTITMTARVTKQSWLEHESVEGQAEVGRRYTLTIRDIGT